jgi:hypothetical protein
VGERGAILRNQGALMSDPRHIVTGHTIPCEEYCDQPYIVQTDDGAWLCVMTTAQGHEGTTSQHVVATRSTDEGRAWSSLIDIEPSGPPESSYVTALKTPSGRIYAFYNHNTDGIREVLHKDGKKIEKRVDTLGHFVFKFSDDHGQTWSAKRYEIPVRLTRVDRENVYGGQIRFFWHVGRPLLHNGAAYVTLHKVGAFSTGFMIDSEGWFLRSPNLLTESDPDNITWETLPEGEVGLRAPKGPIAEEQSIVALSDGSLYCTYRTTEGHPCHAYSRDEGKTWTAPAYMTYANGRLVKHPRAANFVWKCANGNYLYWFHNHGGAWYEDRNPAWIAGGIEVDSPDGKVIHWSQPEILLYDDDPSVRMSYPDLVERDGRFWITETQKTIARVHEIDAKLLEGLWSQFEKPKTIPEGVSESPAPRLTDLREPGAGFSIEMRVRFDNLTSGQSITDTRGSDGVGWTLTTTDRETIRLWMSDGRTEASWECDTELLKVGVSHHLTVTVDGGPKIITFIVDGVLCDGGASRPFGWGRFSPYLRVVSGSEKRRIATNLQGTLEFLRIYRRPLRTSEAVANASHFQGLIDEVSE